MHNRPSLLDWRRGRIKFRAKTAKKLPFRVLLEEFRTQTHMDRRGRIRLACSRDELEKRLPQLENLLKCGEYVEHEAKLRML